MYKIVLVGTLLMLLQACAFRSVRRNKNVDYLRQPGKHESLNVFSPSRSVAPAPVLVFIYGGNWNSGHKGLYNYFGNRMARKGIVTVIADYPKSPAAGYNEMAEDMAAATVWVKENISKFGGDSTRIFLSGHSAGGHLAALVTLKPGYFQELKKENPVKGLILIDAAGLDMYGYLKEENFEEGHTYLETFSNDPATWREASPIYFMNHTMPPMLIFRGGKTYPSIVESNEKFIDSLQALHSKYTYQVLKGKKHIPMILQFFNTYNPRYKEIISFMKNPG